MARKWLKGAVKNPGAFTDWCKAQGYNSVNPTCIAAAKSMATKNKDSHLMKMANFAATAQGGFKKKNA